MEVTTTWTRAELEGYIFIYVANANFKESYEERELIGTKINNETSKKLHHEFSKDNDIQCIEKIQAAISRLAYSDSEKENLVNEVKNLVHADGEFDGPEQATYLALRKLIA